MHAAPRPGPGPRRLLAVVLVGAVLLVQLLLGAANPARACACGGFVDLEDQPAQSEVLQETAVLSLRDGVQTLVMGIALDGERVGSTLLMPTPSAPEVRAAESETLEEMDEATAPREVVEYDLWSRGGDASGGPEEVGQGPTEGAAPTIHQQSRIGDYEVAVLGGETEGVRSWLAENGYALSEELSALIGPYAEDGWTFTAVRYAEDAVLSGAMDPLRLDFATEQLIYPMRFSQAASSPQDVRLFVLAEEPVRRTDASASAQRVQRPWIADPTLHDWSWSDPTLRELVGEDLEETSTGESATPHAVVTEFEIRGEPETFTTDVTFASDPEAEHTIRTYTTTHHLTVAGIPLGYLLVAAATVVAAGSVVILGVLVALVLRVRSRRGA